ncbi:MAG: hypothetical protein ACKOFH_15135 [Chthoniobacterales bacterium]
MDDQKLWNLLGRSACPSAPPFFAGKVMRQIEAGGSERSWLSSALRWLAPAAVAAVAVFSLLPRAAAPNPGVYEDLTTLDIVEMVSPDDYALLTSADVLEDDDPLAAEL